MKKTYICAFVILLTFVQFFRATAQTPLFMPRDMQAAYEKGTRHKNGKPGANYWQNRAAYSIQASIEPKTRRLSGDETVTYVNNSPDTLKRVRFKLAADRYRKGSLRNSDVTPSDISDEGVRIEAFSYNGAAVDEKKRYKQSTFLDVALPAPIAPGASASFGIKWSYTLPAGADAARECVCDSSSFFVPYWYPQIAVYDDIRGWADAPYNGLQEFYHEFADYEVAITMPPGFSVWATGELQNAADIYQQQIVDKWNAAHSSDSVIHVYAEADLKAGTVFKNKQSNTFRFKASNVPDFAFGTSDHYNWDAASVVVDASTGRRTFVGAAYHSNSKEYTGVARAAVDGIRLMSNWLPGYPFPYPSMLVFNGNDAMEYPMMVNDVNVGASGVVSLTVHEVSHTYFPFMMGINEQDYAWMDEGWAAFFDYLLTDSLTNHKYGDVRRYERIAGTSSDVPPMVASRYLSSPAYRHASYQRPQAAYLTLLDLLGYDNFHKCMREYMDRWKGKHPQPFDFFYTWNNASGQNLDWFWKPWFFEWGQPELGIRELKYVNQPGQNIVVIENAGTLPVPIHLDVTYTDGSHEIVHRTAEVWKRGDKNVSISLTVGKKVKTIRMGNIRIPDTNHENNTWNN